MENRYNPTHTLSISNSNLSCASVAQFLRSMNIPCAISDNITVQCNNKTCYIENGCRITTTENIEPIWDALKTQFNLKCAHLSTNFEYHGCIYDFIRNSECPAN